MSSLFGGGSSPQIVIPDQQKSKAFQTIIPQQTFQNAAEYMGRLDDEYNRTLDRQYDQVGTPAEIGARSKGRQLQGRSSYLSSLPYTAGQGVRDVAETREGDAKLAYKNALDRAKTSERKYAPVTKSGFDSRQYLENYRDLRDAFGNDLEKAKQHYIDFGKGEGRTDEDIHGLNKGVPGFARSTESSFLPREANVTNATNETQSNIDETQSKQIEDLYKKYQPKT
tara:strand:+ start:2270 stop:2944 length:675 start_codon:yes stop_codon:yes gene_type:complete